MELEYKTIPRKEIDKHCKQYCESYATCTKTRKQCKRKIGFKAYARNIIMLSENDSLYITYKMRKDRYNEPQATFINTVAR